MLTSQRPNASVIRTPIEVAETPHRASRSSAATSLGRSRRSAAVLKTPAIVAPPRKRKAPVTCRNRTQSYFDTAADSTAPDGRFLQSPRGRTRASPPPPDGNDRGGQPHARSRRSASARRAKGGERPRGRRVLRLP